MKRSMFAVITAASVGLAACGEDATSPENTNLTQAEAEALATILLTQSYENTQGAEPVAGGPQAGPVNLETTVDFSAPCPLGGSVAVSADITIIGDSELEGGTIDYTMTQTHQSCVAQDETSGMTFTLNGNPNMTTEVTFENDGLGNLAIDGTVQGNIAWSKEDKSGTCAITLSFTGSGNQTSGVGSSTASGTVCGVSVSEQLTVG